MGKETVHSDWWMAPAIFSILLWGIALPSLVLESLIEFAPLQWIVSIAIILALPSGFLSLFAYRFDAEDIQEADSDWRPLWPLYIVGHFVAGPIVAPIYVLRRGARVGNDWGRLWGKLRLGSVRKRVKRVA